MSNEIHLYFDDTGSRQPDHHPEKRNDGVDCFGLGGFLINEEDKPAVRDAHRDFCANWNIDYPLHSTKIRGSRGTFGWLQESKIKNEFLRELNNFLLNLPILGIGSIIHRPGYVKRYRESYVGRTWEMDKTAFMILVERSAKYAKSKNRFLKIHFEKAGKSEDRDIISYAKDMKTAGLPFDSSTSKRYGALTEKDLKRIIRGEPQRLTKNDPLMQIADLYLWPMAKAGYDENYGPYRKLMDAGRLIDARLSVEDCPLLGIKYSCFDD